MPLLAAVSRLQPWRLLASSSCTIRRVRVFMPPALRTSSANSSPPRRSPASLTMPTMPLNILSRAAARILVPMSVGFLLVPMAALLLVHPLLDPQARSLQVLDPPNPKPIGDGSGDR